MYQNCAIWFSHKIRMQFYFFFPLQISKSSNFWIGVLRRSLVCRARQNRVSSLCCNFLERVIPNLLCSFPHVCFATHVGSGKQMILFFQFVFKLCINTVKLGRKAIQPLSPRAKGLSNDSCALYRIHFVSQQLGFRQGLSPAVVGVISSFLFLLQLLTNLLLNQMLTTAMVFYSLMTDFLTHLNNICWQISISLLHPNDTWHLLWFHT